MTPGQLQDAITLGREQRGVEFKSSGRRDDGDFMAKVTRAVLGMANNEDGGVVVIGVTEQQAKLTLTGLTDADLATWAYDDVQDVVSSYADPYVDFDIEPVTIDTNTAVVISVRPFVETPVLCKKDRNHSKKNSIILQRGALYIRTRGKNSTVPASSHVEMREVLDRAAEATARRLIAMSRRIQPGPTDADRFADEAKDLL